MKTLTIARATALEAIRQPAFLVLGGLGLLVLVVTIFLPYYTFNEDIKMYKDTGLATVTFITLILALLTSSSTVAEEIEGKTAVTLLSKPINRRQFIVGKFLGIEGGVLAMFLLLGLLMMAGTYFKADYDMKESAGTTEEFAKKVAHVWQIVPGLVLGFMEVTILASISLAISTRMPMLVNLVVCITIFFLGHMSQVLVDKTNEAGASVNELVKFMAKLFAWALPSLEFFNTGPAISTGSKIPWVAYVLPSMGYCALYSGAALLFAFLLFENRDVA